MKNLNLLVATVLGGFMLAATPAATATSYDAAPSAPAAMLSSAELEVLRVGAANDLPPDCRVIEDSQGVCLAIVCSGTLFVCDAFD